MPPRAEALPDPAAVAAPHAVVRHPAIFLALFTPFGISSGYIGVTLAFLLGRAGLSTLAIATIIAAGIWVQTWKVLWAPVVDTIGNPKLWYGLGVAGIGAAMLAMSVLPATAAQVPAFTVLAMLSSAASTLTTMSAEIFLTQCVADGMRGRASGWAQAGNLGGGGVGGGLGLLLAEHVAQPWVSGAVLAAICVACWACLRFVPRAVPSAQRGGARRTLRAYLAELQGVVRDVWDVARSRVGALAIVLMLLPISSGAVVWSAIAGEWRAEANLVALINGVVGGLAAAAGALLGGYVCDRMRPQRAYCLFGLVVGGIAVAMAWAPRTPATFVVFTLAYSAAVGCGYAAYSAIVLEAIGRRSAATNFSLMASLANVPVAAMTSFDGWVHDRFGTNAMLYGELALPAAAIAGFALLVVLTRPRTAAPSA